MARRVGSLRDTSFVGQDPKRRGQLEAQLFEDFKPEDVLEEIWLSEIASLTTTIEYYRRLEVSLNYTIVASRGLDGFLKAEEAEAAMQGKVADRGADPLTGTAFLMAMGRVSQDNLRAINAIIEIINKLRRERERIYMNFDRKRRPSIVNAVKYREVTPEDDPSPDSSAD
jgi:hypothetical protein